MIRHPNLDVSVPEDLREALDPSACALVVYDMQVGILTQLADGAAILAKVRELLDAARSAGFPVVFLRHMSLPRRLAGRFQMRQAMAWQRASRIEDVDPWFLRGSDGFALAPELAPRDDEVVFDKIGMSAFEGTPLGIAMRDAGLHSFLVCGVATEIGIDPTVRHAADLGFLPIVVEDACGHGHAESATRTFENMRFLGDAIVTTVAEVREVMDARTS